MWWWVWAVWILQYISRQRLLLSYRSFLWGSLLGLSKPISCLINSSWTHYSQQVLKLIIFLLSYLSLLHTLNLILNDQIFITLNNEDEPDEYERPNDYKKQFNNFMTDTEPIQIKEQNLGSNIFFGLADNSIKNNEGLSFNNSSSATFLHNENQDF